MWVGTRIDPLAEGNGEKAVLTSAEAIELAVSGYCVLTTQLDS